MIQNPLDSELAALDHDLRPFLLRIIGAFAAAVFGIWLAIALIFTGEASTWLWGAGIAGALVWVYILARIAWIEFFKL